MQDATAIPSHRRATGRYAKRPRDVAACRSVADSYLNLWFLAVQLNDRFQEQAMPR